MIKRNVRNGKLLAALLFSLTAYLTGCQPAAPAAKLAPPPMPTATPFVPVTKHYNGVGVVTKIDNDLGTVGLDHEEIKGLMPAMSMEYYVKEKSMLKAVKVGQKVDFTVEDVSANESISALTPKAEAKK
ncbi:MAG: copper-binding protein [Pyrinomonadaceae bacterium]